MLDVLLEKLRGFDARLNSKPETRWGTVTNVSPVEVRFDGEAETVRPQLLATPILGSRVLCLIQRRQVILLGGVQTAGARSGDYRCGVLSERDAWLDAPYFAVFVDSETGSHFWRDRSGQWQAYSGRATVTPTSWASQANFNFLQTLEYVLPVVLSERETIAIDQVETSGRFGTLSVLNVTRRENSTSVSTAYTQFNNARFTQVTISWRVIPVK